MENNRKEQYYAVGFKGDGCTRTCVTLYEQRELALSEYHPLEHSIQENYRMLCKEKEFAGLRDSQCYSPVQAEPYHTYKLNSVTGDIINDSQLDGFSYDIERKNVIYGTIYVYAQKNNNQYYNLVTGKIIPKEVIKTVDEISSIRDMEEMIEDLKFIKQYKEIYIKTMNKIISKLLEGYKNYRSALKIFDQRYHEYKEKIKSELQFKKDNDTLFLPKEENEADKKREEVKQLVLELRNATNS